MFNGNSNYSTTLFYKQNILAILYFTARKTSKLDKYVHYLGYEYLFIHAINRVLFHFFQLLAVECAFKPQFSKSFLLNFVSLRSNLEKYRVVCFEGIVIILINYYAFYFCLMYLNFNENSRIAASKYNLWKPTYS